MSDSGERMRRFWDERAREDAFFFVDNRIAYRDPAAAQAFWDGGRTDLEQFLAAADLTLRSDDEVVEIGCGVGRLTRVLAQRVASVRALDVSEEMLSLARRENGGLENVEWIHGDGVSLAGIADASADAVVSHVVFQHIPDPAITLGYVREMGRVLKPGGVAAFQVSNDPAVHERRSGWRDRLKARVGRAPRGQADDAWTGSAVELDDLRRAAGDGHLQVEKLFGEGTQYMLVRLRRA